MMTMSCHSDSEGAHKHDNDILQQQERKSNDDSLVKDHPPAATSTSPEVNTNTALTMMSRAAKKQRTSDKCSLSPSAQLHQHLYQYQQKSSSVRGLNEDEDEECSSDVATTVSRMPNTNTYNEEEEASSFDEEVEKKPSQDHPQEGEGGDPNPITINDTIMQNLYLPRPSSFSSLLSLASHPSHSHPEHTQHDKHENPDDNTLPLSLAVPYSPNWRQFGDEYYISPKQERPAPAVHLKNDPLPSAAAVATETEETKMKANSDGREDSADLPPPLPFLPAKGSCTSTSSQRNAWDRKFNELVSLRTSYEIQDCSVTLFPSIICSFLLPFFSLILSSSMAIVMYHRLMRQIPNLGYG